MDSVLTSRAHWKKDLFWEIVMFASSLVGAVICTIIATKGRKRLGGARSHKRLVFQLFFGNLLAFITVNYIDPPHYAEAFYGLGGRFIFLLWSSLLYRYLIYDDLDCPSPPIGNVTDPERSEWRDMKPRFILAWTLSVVYLFETASSFPSILPATYSSVIGLVEKKESLEEFSIEANGHIAMVSQADAQEIGGRFARNLSVSYDHEQFKFTLQKVDGELYWVAPLFPESGEELTKDSPLPGIVLIDAKNFEVLPKIVGTDSKGKKFNFRFSPSSILDENLPRHIWFSGYTEYTVSEAHIELDDAMDPYWVVALTQPSARAGGEKVTKALVVNPATGAIESYALNEVPGWVDWVIPKNIALESIKNWVAYAGGTSAGSLAKRKLSVDEHVSRMYRSDGSAVWLVGLCSITDKDSRRLSSILSIDARRGDATEYLISGRSEIDAVHAADMFQGDGGYPALACIDGQAYWIVPNVSANMRLSGVSCVKIAGDEVFTGATLEEVINNARQSK